MTEQTDKTRRTYPSREGERFFGAYVPEHLIKKIRILAIEQGVTNKVLMLDFIKDGLKKYGKTIE